MGTSSSGYGLPTHALSAVPLIKVFLWHFATASAAILRKMDVNNMLPWIFVTYIQNYKHDNYEIFDNNNFILAWLVGY